jgi:hypothetical protein
MPKLELQRWKGKTIAIPVMTKQEMRALALASSVPVQRIEPKPEKIKKTKQSKQLKQNKQKPQVIPFPKADSFAWAQWKRLGARVADDHVGGRFIYQTKSKPNKRNRALLDEFDAGVQEDSKWIKTAWS